jgi:hypothetical protein
VDRHDRADRIGETVDVESTAAPDGESAATSTRYRRVTLYRVSPGSER